MNRATFRLLALGGLLPLSCWAAQVDIAVNPSATMLATGESSFVDLVASYDGADKLLGGAVSLSFRADLLEVVEVTLLAPSDVGGSAGAVVISGDNGTVSGIGFATFAGAAGTFNLARIEFRALAATGVSALTAFDPGDPVFAWVNESFEPVSVTSTGSSIAVSAVPEPQTYALWTLGLLAIGSWLRTSPSSGRTRRSQASRTGDCGACEG